MPRTGCQSYARCLLALASYRPAGDSRATCGLKWTSVKSLMAWLFEDVSGQDLIEYSLLLAFIALAGAALFGGMSTSLNAIWTKINSTLASPGN